MCNEPMQGVAVFLEDVACHVSDEEASQSMGRLTGEIIRTVRESIRQGFLEESNVDSVFEITRMIEVQRAYELGQSFLDREDQRIRSAITGMTR